MKIFRTWIAKQPIQKKLIYSNMLGIVFAFAPVVFSMVVYEYFALRNAVIQEVGIQADIIGESSSAALAFMDHTAASETLATLKKSNDFLEAHLFSSEGQLFESYYKVKGVKKTQEIFTNSQNPSVTLDIATITITKPIFLRSEFVGSLVLVSGLQSFYMRLLWYMIITVTVACIGLFLAWSVAVRVSQTIIEPLSRLTEVTQKMVEHQNYDEAIPVSVDSQDEVGILFHAFKEMMSQIHQRDLGMQQLAYYDRITEIPNRHYFEEKIEQAVANAQRYGTACYLFMIDLDDFKIVNDTLGHHIGDLLLRSIAEILQNTMRQNDSIFRIGGDEFTILLESPSMSEAVGKVAQKIIKAVAAPIVLEGHTVQVGVSIGISCYPKHAHDVRTLMNSADIAMYEAKNNGKNSYKVYGF